MQIVKDARYHESAIYYNAQAEEFFAKLAEDPELENATVRKWCLGISKQHEFHGNRHKKSLANLGTDAADTGAVETDPNAEHVLHEDEPMPAEPVETGPDEEKAADPVQVEPSTEEDAEPVAEVQA